MSAHAEVYEIKMLNRGKAGPMIFEPDYIELKPGDSLKFLATHKTHNAASIPELMPESAPKFKGKINQEIEVPFDIEGFYGIQCTPHYAQGMVMIVKVGDAKMSDEFKAFKAPGKAHERFQKIIKDHNL